MEYRLTFEDGSDGYLSHHGVLGMKWGVRNAETRARYASEGRGRSSGYSTGSSGSGHSGLTDKQKRMLKGAAIGVGAAAAIGGGVYLARNKALRKAAVERGARIAQSKANLARERKRIGSEMKKTQENFTGDWVSKHAHLGASQKSARMHLKDSYRYAQAQRKTGLKYPPSGRTIGMHPTDHPSFLPAKKMESLAEEYRLNKQLHAYNVDTANRIAAGRKKTIDTLTKIGQGTAVGVGAGAGTAYYKVSTKRGKKNRAA